MLTRPAETGPGCVKTQIRQQVDLARPSRTLATAFSSGQEW
jgi:hypothetical protein